MSRLGLRRRLRHAGRHITDRQAAKGPSSLPAGGSAPHPAPVVGESLFRRSDAQESPTFTPAPAKETRPIAGLAPADAVAASRPRPVRPFVSAGAPKALLFDALADVLPLPPVMSAGEKRSVLLAPGAAEPGCAVELYSGPGWARAVEAYRLRDGEWEDPQAGLDQIATRTAAGFTTARGHIRETLAGGWRSIREQSAPGATPAVDWETLP